MGGRQVLGMNLGEDKSVRFPREELMLCNSPGSHPSGVDIEGGKQQKRKGSHLQV